MNQLFIPTYKINSVIEQREAVFWINHSWKEWIILPEKKLKKSMNIEILIYSVFKTFKIPEILQVHIPIVKIYFFL